MLEWLQKFLNNTPVIVMYAKRLGLKRPYGKEKTSQICKRKADDTKHTAKITIVYCRYAVEAFYTSLTLET